jgi:hypothetical protein
MSDSDSGVQVGSIIGSVAAAYLSWVKWHSVTWVIIHAMCSWFYVIYYAFKYGMPS